MNLVLFEDGEIHKPISPGDDRARHLRETLRCKIGDSFDCGRIGGPRGCATVVADAEDGMHLAFEWGSSPPPPDPIRLIVGLPRPQTVRKILREATSLGVERMLFFVSARTEPSYASSSLWSGKEVRRHLIAGAGQAFCTHVPGVELVSSLETAVANAEPARTRLALDNYEAGASLASVALAGKPTLLAVGSERGWANDERDLLRSAGFTLVHLGGRVLRTETACVAGIALLRARLGLMT